MVGQGRCEQDSMRGRIYITYKLIPLCCRTKINLTLSLLHLTSYKKENPAVLYECGDGKLTFLRVRLCLDYRSTLHNKMLSATKPRKACLTASTTTAWFLPGSQSHYRSCSICHSDTHLFIYHDHNLLYVAQFTVCSKVLQAFPNHILKR